MKDLELVLVSFEAKEKEKKYIIEINKKESYKLN